MRQFIEFNGNPTGCYFLPWWFAGRWGCWRCCRRWWVVFGSGMTRTKEFNHWSSSLSWELKNVVIDLIIKFYKTFWIVECNAAWLDAFTVIRMVFGFMPMPVEVDSNCSFFLFIPCACGMPGFLIRLKKNRSNKWKIGLSL